MNYKMIAHTLGWVLNCEAVCMLLPMICSAIYGERCVGVFAVCIAICLVVGVSLSAMPVKNKSMYAKEGFVTVALSWIIMSIFGALPFVFSGAIQNFADALFETVSGFTTTGASILRDVEIIPKGLIFWRSFTHWIGGMGVLVFLVAILPLSGGNNFYLIKAESPGPSVSKLVPKIKSSAKWLYGMYILLTALQILLLIGGGLNLFEALTLSFGTAGTGGFAIKNSGIADYSSYVQNVITIFMIIFGIDFTFYYLIISKRAKEALKLEEVRTYLGIILTAVILIMINCRGMFAGFFDGLKHTAFQVASIITTTGYSTVDFDLWPEFSKTILIILMFVGACAGSTGGGIKVSRIMILFKGIFREIKVAAHPKTTHKLTINGRSVGQEVIRAVNVYIAAYLVIFILSILLISLDNLNFTTNFTAVASAMNNIGPGFSEVGPTRNFSIYSQLSTVVLTLDMLVGRLEIFPVLILFSPYTWKR